MQRHTSSVKETDGYLADKPTCGKQAQHESKSVYSLSEETLERPDSLSLNHNHLYTEREKKEKSSDINDELEGKDKIQNHVRNFTEDSKSSSYDFYDGRHLEVPSPESLDGSDITDTMTCSDTESNERQLNIHARHHKIKMIHHALMHSDSDSLRKAAAEKWGLVKGEARRKAWPVLVGVDVFETSPRPSMEEIESHPYYNQVVMDVNRSIKRFPPSIKENQRLAMQDQLVFLIMRILLKHSELHYYQGYHDICVTFLLVLGEEIAFTVVDKLSISHLRVFMDETMERTTEVLNYIYPLIRKKNSDLCEFLARSEVGVMFCLSWLITWFGHVLNKYSEVVRLFDFFIVSHPWMPVYLSAAIVLYREDEILQQSCDMASVHSLLSNIPDDLPLENLVVNAQHLFESYPPNVLKKEVPHFKLQPQRRNRGRSGSVSTFVHSVRNMFPESRWTMSLAVATAVIMYAVFYQTCRTAGISMD